MGVHYHQFRQAHPLVTLSSRQYKGNNCITSFYDSFVTRDDNPVRDVRMGYGKKKHAETAAYAQAHL
jgi:hypothetical protein